MSEPVARPRYQPTFHPDGRKVYNPNRTGLDIYDEWDALTELVKAEDPDCPYPEMRAKELWRQQEEKGERWKEWQQRVWHPRMAARAAERPSPEPGLTRAEAGLLVEHFTGANDPVAQGLLRKALDVLGR